MLTRESGIVIPRSHSKYESAMKDLTKKTYEWNGDVKLLYLYHQTDDGVLVPRFYPLDDTLQDNTILGDEINVKSSIVPRSERQKRSIKYITTNTNGILKLEPGSGKTVLSIDSICRIGRKAIVLVHKLELAKQWVEQVVNFTDLKEEDVGFIRSKNYKEELKKPIIVSTVQTLVSIMKRDDYNDDLKTNNIGVAIFDECHTTIGPEVFSRVSYNLNCKRVFGLSATPSRFGCDDILYYHLGEIVYYPPEEDELLKPDIYICHFPFGIYKRYKKFISWGGTFQQGRYDKQMAKVDTYLDVTSTLIRNAYKKGNRKILVMGKRVESLLNLARRCKFDRDKVGIFISGAPKKDILELSDTTDFKEAFHTKDIVFATYGMARDGNNRENFDCLIMTVPTSNIVQAIGRVCRTMDGKATPIVLDLVDTEGPLDWSIHDDSRTDPNKRIPLFVKSMEKRIEQYKQLGWIYKYSKIDINRK